MEKFITIPSLSVKKLVSLGLDVEMSQDKMKMRLKISDKNLKIFECDLIEEDYPNEFPETYSILELDLNRSIKRSDSKLSHFTSTQSDDLIFGYFQNELLPSLGIEVCKVKMYYL